MMDQLLREVNADHSQFVLKCKSGNAVLIAEQDWIELSEYLFARPGLYLDEIIEECVR